MKFCNYMPILIQKERARHGHSCCVLDKLALRSFGAICSSIAHKLDECPIADFFAVFGQSAVQLDDAFDIVTKLNLIEDLQLRIDELVLFSYGWNRDAISNERKSQWDAQRTGMRRKRLSLPSSSVTSLIRVHLRLTPCVSVCLALSIPVPYQI